MTLYAVEAEVYVEAGSPVDAEARVFDLLRSLTTRRGVLRVAAGLSREADITEIEEKR